MTFKYGLVIATFISIALSAKPCIPRDYGHGGTVCVCNSTYCDTVDPVKKLPHGEYLLYSSSMDGLRLKRTSGGFAKWQPNSKAAHYLINSNKTFQHIMGFGGAFTDSAGINILSLSKQTQENFLKSYFSWDGIEYNMGRVPIAGCDFSTHTYTYDDVPGDVNLSQFKLTMEDFTYKIPLIKRANDISLRPIKLVASPWTAPPWMKTNNDYSGLGFLKEEYYQAWADYLVKFLDEYKEEGVDIWAITTGNEPINGIIPLNRFNSMGWSATSQRKWIANHFGPGLRGSQHNETKLIALDDQRFFLPRWVETLMEDEEAGNYIDGIGVHWYWDFLFSARLLSDTHEMFPDKFILGTEACVGDKPWDFQKVSLGSWSRGEQYIEDIIEDLRHWVVGWIDWNLALNATGGPNWAHNYVDAAVIVNATADEFYKQPMFYALGHFSKFIPENSIVLQTVVKNDGKLEVMGFQKPDGGKVVIVFNRRNNDIPVTVTDTTRGHINLLIPKRSIHTLLYW